MRRVIEKYTRNARFCLICNYASKVIPALQSRCTRFRFAPLAPEQARTRLGEVARQEAVDSTDEGLDACVTLGLGDMRKCLNILQSTHMAFARVDVKNVYQCTGSPMPDDVEAIVRWLLQEEFDSCFDNCWRTMSEKGLALSDVLTKIASARADELNALADEGSRYIVEIETPGGARTILRQASLSSTTLTLRSCGVGPGAVVGLSIGQREERGRGTMAGLLLMGGMKSSLKRSSWTKKKTLSANTKKVHALLDKLQLSDRKEEQVVLAMEMHSIFDVKALKGYLALKRYSEAELIEGRTSASAATRSSATLLQS